MYLDGQEDVGAARAPRDAVTGEDNLSKAVSANISAILEELLEDYDETERPSFKEGQPWTF